jgi:hypothetical protein
MIIVRRLFAAGWISPVFAACAPEVGSERWCAQMEEKPAGDWSFSEAKSYAKHCILEGDDRSD